MMKTYQNHAMTDAEARQALADACKQVETNLPLYTYQCQNHSSVNDIYPGCANNQWTCGFWPGEIWLAYEATGDEKFKTAALIQVDSFADRIARKVEVDHHDMGFLYSPTCVAAWKLVGSEKGKNAAIAAAGHMHNKLAYVAFGAKIKHNRGGQTVMLGLGRRAFRAGKADKRKPFAPRRNFADLAVGQLAGLIVLIIYICRIIVITVNVVALIERKIGILRRSEHAARDGHKRDGKERCQKLFHFVFHPSQKVINL